MTKNARRIAAEALMQINNEQGYSNLVLSSRLESSGLSERDTAFAAALIYGVLERRITLDYCIARYSKIPLKKLDRQVLEILRLSVYQLLYMDSVPDSAAVNEGAALARAMRKTSAAGFINGVLRSFLRDGKKVLEDDSLDEKQRLSVLCSAPVWLVELLCSQYGEVDAIGILEASLGKPPVYLRANTLKTTPDELVELLREVGTEAELCSPDGCIKLLDGAEITSLRGFEQGLFHVQDRASQLCCAALSPQAEERVLDVCAAPGGKSFTLAQMMQNTGELLACDIYSARLGLIESGAQRLGLEIVKTLENDAQNYNEALGSFDRVLCDVPCSGLGIIRRKPEIKYKDEKLLEGLPERQYSILEASAQYLRAGGVLVYSTCTLNRAENERIVQRFLGGNPDFEPLELLGADEQGGFYRTLLPHLDDSDGFFIATMRRVK